MKRTSKRYVVTSDALNCYGYRVLTSGVDFTQYEKNPILLWMHLRANSNDKNQILPLGSAVELKQEDDNTITCYLEFDETDAYAMQVYNKYENGTLNMLSLGAKPVEWSDDPADMVQGQTGPTFTKSLMTDISCVDMGGNPDACACQLYDANDKKIDLSDIDGEGLIKLLNPLHKLNDDKNTNMKLIQLTGPALTGILLALKLKEDATEADVQKEVADLAQNNITLAGEVATLKLAKTNLETAKSVAEKELNELKAAQNGEKVIALVDGGITAKKILPGQKDAYIALATADFANTKAILDGMTGTKTIKEQLELGAKETTELGELIKLSWDDLHQSGKLERLKALDNEAYEAKREAKFPKSVTKK